MWRRGLGPTPPFIPSRTQCPSLSSQCEGQRDGHIVRNSADIAHGNKTHCRPGDRPFGVCGRTDASQSHGQPLSFAPSLGSWRSPSVSCDLVQHDLSGITSALSRQLFSYRFLMRKPSHRLSGLFGVETLSLLSYGPNRDPLE